MAKIEITIPDNQVERVVTAVCSRGRYEATLPNGEENPQKPGDFVKAQIVMFLRHTTVEYEAEQARLHSDINIT